MMTIQGPKDPNRGPFKLEYDVTPKDLTEYNPAFDAGTVKEDFRYQGFPNGSFEKPRGPVAIAQSEPRENISVEYYPLKRWFDTNRPLGTGSATGFKYGSEGEARDVKPTPRAIRDPFKERTSAELRKFKKIQDEVDVDFQKMKEDRVLRATKDAEEKRRDMEQLKNYNPWGKPGHGAPNPKSYDRRQQDKLLTGGYSFNDGFSKPGGGAPLRTPSGNVKAGLHGDTMIRFQNTKDGPMIYDKEVRYKGANPKQTNEYKAVLEAQQEEARRRRNEERIENLQRDLEMARHDPFGKPGAGAPNRHSDAERQHHGNMGSDYDPWGKGYGAPHRDEYGDVIRHRQADARGVHTDPDYTPRGNSLPLDTSRGGAGAPLRADDGAPKTRFPITMKRDDRGDASIRESMPGQSQRHFLSDDPELQIYDPWGKGGGGAPLRDKEGRIKPSVFGKMQYERNADEIWGQDAKTVYRREQQQIIAEQRRNRQEQDKELKTGEGELAAIIRTGRVGNPRRDKQGLLANQHLATTDVTQEKTNEKKYKNMESAGYLSELEKEASDREMQKKLDKLKEQRETQHPVDFYSKNVPTGKQPYNYVRNTTNSTSNNYYDFDPQFKRAPPQQVKPNYPRLDAPWAKTNDEGVF